VVSEFEIGGRGGLGHVAGEAVTGAPSVGGGVAYPALFLVEGEVGSDGVGVSRVAVDAGEASGLEATAFDKPERLEADI
jgi:hypothetical protein